MDDQVQRPLVAESSEPNHDSDYEDQINLVRFVGAVPQRPQVAEKKENSPTIHHLESSLFQVDTEAFLATHSSNYIEPLFAELRAYLGAITAAPYNADDAKCRYTRYLDKFYRQLESLSININARDPFSGQMRLCVHHIHSVDYTLKENDLFKSLEKLTLTVSEIDQHADDIVQVFLVESYPKEHRRSCFQKGNVFVMASVSHIKELLTELPVNVYVSYGQPGPRLSYLTKSLAAIISVNCNFAGCESLEEIRKWKMHCLNFPRSYNDFQNLCKSFDSTNCRNEPYNHYIIVRDKCSVGSVVEHHLTTMQRMIRHSFKALYCQGQQALSSYWGTQQE